MCFEFGSCFGNRIREDYGGERSARKPPQGGRGRGNHRNEAYHSGGATDYKVPLAETYHNQPHTAVDEAGNKAYHDGTRKDNHVSTDTGGHGGNAPNVQDQQADQEAPKHPAWHNKVGDDAGYIYRAHLQETQAGRRKNAAMDYHHYPTTTANTTTLVRY